ncbi:YcgL domain-containing protein [Litorilituus sediminis]|uniref:YcgL domain-containing protein EMK97_18690 n=1 Tax=Litorilituus sediminis TaxID=718192 RepID=A0A4P6PCV5_9GAMM|nr:YcgL domain-containing protein [Litorilituus sediminis]QBG37612.1 YcgL domain-containing protein [Litorilituus sediminis]
MLCAIYKSAKKEQTYLFIKKRDDFSDVPEALMTTFGTPTLVTIVNLATKDKLGMADINKVKTSLDEQGFYLQLPPPKEDMLKAHKAEMMSNKKQGA